jgi:hypothetical protein
VAALKVDPKQETDLIVKKKKKTLLFLTLKVAIENQSVSPSVTLLSFSPFFAFSA